MEKLDAVQTRINILKSLQKENPDTGASHNYKEELEKLITEKSHLEFVQNPKLFSSLHWTVLKNALDLKIMELVINHPTYSLSILKSIEKFLIEEGILTEQDIRREL